MNKASVAKTKLEDLSINTDSLAIKSIIKTDRFGQQFNYVTNVDIQSATIYYYGSNFYCCINDQALGDAQVTIALHSITDFYIDTSIMKNSSLVQDIDDNLCFTIQNYVFKELNIEEKYKLHKKINKRDLQ